MDGGDPVGVARVEQVQVPAAVFRWLRDDEQAIDRSPMERVRPPKTPTKLVPVLRSEVMVQLTGRAELKAVADEAAARLRAALDTLA